MELNLLYLVGKFNPGLPPTERAFYIKSVIFYAQFFIRSVPGFQIDRSTCMMPQERCQKSGERRGKGGCEVCFP